MTVGLDNPIWASLETIHDEFASRYYPQFFRRQTAELGTFFGVREAGRLIAISGERLGTPECAEMSTVVVAPSQAGRGIGRQLARSSVRRRRSRTRPERR